MTTTPADVQFALDILAAHEQTTGQAFDPIEPYAGQPAPFSLDAMIADAASKLGVVPTEGKDEVEAADPDTITELWTKAEELKKIEDRAKKDRAKITEILKKTTPEGTVLTVHGAPLFANTITASRVLDQAAVKNRFPDVAGNEWAYKDQIGTRADYKR